MSRSYRSHFETRVPSPHTELTGRTLAGPDRLPGREQRHPLYEPNPQMCSMSAEVPALPTAHVCSPI
jgi:hypothetical protein